MAERWWGRTPPYRVGYARDVAVDSTGCIYVVDQVNCRVQQFDLAGNYVRHWGSEGSREGQFRSPCGLALDSEDNVYVADTGNHRIQKFTASGEFLAAFGSYGSGNGQLNGPEGVAVDAAGFVYVADTGNFRVQVFDSTGSYVRKWGSAGSGDGQFGSPSGIAVDTSGNVYVSDRSLSTPRIQKFSSTGAFLGKWGSYGSGDGQFMSCRDVAVVGSQYVFASDSARRVQKFSTNGAFLGKWGTAGTGEGQFGDIYGIAVDTNGLVYVADAGNSRVQKFEPSGVFAASWGFEIAGLGQLKRPGQIAVTAGNKVYVADTDNCRIQVFDTSGRLLQHWGSAGIAAGQFKAPRAVAVSAAGEVFVADTGNHRVQAFGPDGSFLRQFGVFGRSPGQFDSPSGITVGPDDKVYVTDARGRVQRFTAEGVYETSFYSNGGSSQTADAWKGVAIDSSGNVYVVDEYGNCVQKFDSNGVFKAKWGTLGSGNGQFFQPSGIAVDGDGRVYVADTQNNRIQVFDSNGTYLGQWGSRGGLTGQFANPAGVGVDSEGNVYVSDTDNNRIQKFRPYSAALAPLILLPTSDPTYCSPLSSIDISGTTIGDVTEVDWTNDRGGGGTCTLDAGRWNVVGVELQEGVNVITITARDGAGAAGSTTLTVMHDPVGPSIAVTSEVPAETQTAYLIVRGTASDNVEVSKVGWINRTTNKWGLCTGTTDWEGTVPLAVGPNTVVIYALDACSNVDSVELPEVRFVDADPPEIGSLEVTAVGDPPQGRLVVYVTDWGGVYRVTWANDLGDTGECEPAAGASVGGDPPQPPLGQEWAASGIPIHVGLNVITVTAYDTSGNSSTKRAELFVPDVTPPTVVIVSPTIEPTFTIDAETVTIQGTASDDLAVVNVTWANDQGGSGTCVGTTSWTAQDVPLKFGENQITITASDAAGNSGSDTIIVTRIGTDPPTITITSPTADPAWATTNQKLDLAGVASDDVGVTSVTWSNDRGGSGTCTGTTSWSVTGIPLSVGTNVITVTAHDTSGKTGQDSITVTFTDRTGPKVTITTPATDPYGTQDATIAIAGAADDDVATTQVSWKTDRGYSGSCVGTYSWSADAVPLEMGQNIITVTARDAAGNRGSASVSVVRGDGEKPTISITQPTTEPTYSTTEPTIDVSGTADDNVGVISVVAANDRGGTWLCSGTTNWTAVGIQLKAGDNVLTFTARDATGNTESVQLTVTLTDTTPPTIAITDPTEDDSYLTSAAVVSISGTASDDVEVVGVTWSSDSGGSGNCDGSTSWTADGIALAMGPNVITVTAVDGAGNEASDTIVITRTDGTPPTVVITSPTSTPTYSTAAGTLSISGTADDDVGVVSVTWSNNRGGSGTCSGTASWSASGIALAIGENVITVRATDAAGNSGTDTLTVTRVDAESPSVTITSPTSADTYSTDSGLINLAGTAADNVGVTSVTWSNDRGGGGTCTGTT
ncbi:MAG: Ig-like domain-containing protein, partial [Armatimonadota bacterium]